MSDPASAAIDLLGTALGSSLGFTGGLISNDANAEQAHKNRKLQLLAAKKMIRWRVEDLRKAGLNPVLAANSALGGSGSISGSSVPQTNPFSEAGSILSKGVSSAVSASQRDEELETLKKQQASQEALNKSASDKNNADRLESWGRALKHFKELEKFDERYALYVRNAEATINNLMSSTAKNEAEAANIDADTQGIRQRIDFNAELHNLNMERFVNEIRNLKIDTVAKQQRIDLDTFKLALLKMTEHLKNAKTLEEIEYIRANTALLYSKVFGTDLDNDLKRYQQGVRLDPEVEKVMATTERVIDSTDKLLGSVAQFVPYGALARGANSALSAAKNAFRRRETPSLGKSHGKYGNRGVTKARFNNDEQVSNYRNY